MCRLTIKLRVIGKKNQEFVRFIMVPKNRRQRGKYITSFGYWDTRKNTGTRFVVLNIYKLMYYYSYGAKANKTSLRHIFNYFLDVTNLSNWFYFNKSELMKIVEYEIKKKYL